jgi:hypothetical protein
MTNVSLPAMTTKGASSFSLHNAIKFPAMIAARTLLLVSTLLLLTPAYSQKPRLPRPLPAPSVFPSGSVVEYQWDLDCIETGTDTRRCVFNSPDQAFPRAANASIFLVKFVTPSRQYPVYAWSVTSVDGQIAWGLTEVPSQFHYSAAQMAVGWAGVPQPP